MDFLPFSGVKGLGFCELGFRAFRAFRAFSIRCAAGGGGVRLHEY